MNREEMRTEVDGGPESVLLNPNVRLPDATP